MPARPAQLRLPEDPVALHEVAFVVLDLETTGGSPQRSAITEVGAVRVRGGRREGELQTLVDPGAPIPAQITSLTGIDDATVAGRPTIDGVLPALLEFCQGAVLVAHNARFDVGFLDAALERAGRPRLDHPVVCTAALARRLLREEVRDCRLATLANYLRAHTVPRHRALADARATVDVLHALIERAGALGATTLADLRDLTRAGSAPVLAARRHLADGLPEAPGVYAFTSASGERLYVGTAGDLRARVRSYFGSDQRRGIPALLRATRRVEHWTTPTALEAEVTEARLIAAAKPRHNRRGKRPPSTWLRLTAERYPRLSIVHRRPEVPALGPLASRRAAEEVADALGEAAPIRRCTDRIGPRVRVPPCVLLELGRCAGPCDGRVDPEGYEEVLAPVRAAIDGDASEVLRRLETRMRRRAAAGRFEEAAGIRDRAEALTAAVARTRRRRGLERVEELVAAAPVRDGWEIARVVRGRLAGTARTSTLPASSALPAAVAPAGPVPEAPPEGPIAEAEADLLARWLGRHGVRCLHAAPGACEPAAGGAALADVEARLRRSRRGTGRPADELDAKRLRRADDSPGGS